MTDRRRPFQRDDLDVETALQRAVNAAPEIELGWSLLKRKMRDAGWPTRTPDGDRRSRRRPAMRCSLCGETFATADGVRTHRDETGHDEYAADQQLGSTLDYADPTGEMALRLDALADDLDTMQDHWHLVTTSLRATADIARKHIPAAGGTHTEPACSVTTCDGTVERTTSGNGYRGMELIAGHHVAKPGVQPLCAKHRKMTERRNHGE